MTAVMTAERVGVRWGYIDILADVSIGLEPGRFSILIGPNGAGKSTLLRLLAGTLAPERGRVLWGREPLHAIEAWRLAGARAVLAQTIAVALPFTVRETVRLGCEGIGRGLRRRDRDALVETALVEADAAGLANRVIQTLSGGEQQRVHYARVLCQLAAGRTLHQHQALLLDEPTASLDLRFQIALLDHAAGLARAGLAVFAILHDLNLAAAYADDLLVLDGGRLIAHGTPAQVLTDARLADIFGVDLKVGAVPPLSIPFVLPVRPRKQP